MVLRFQTSRHTGTIIQDELTFLAPPEGGDVAGNGRLLMGVRSQVGANKIRSQVSTSDWGPRVYETMPKGQGGAIDGLRTDWLLHPQFIKKNQTIRLAEQQDSAGVQAQVTDLLYIESDNFPKALMDSAAEITALFFGGTASIGEFGATANASQKLEQEEGSAYWPIAMGGVGTPGSNAQITYPAADGIGPQVPLNGATYQERTWSTFAPLAPIFNADTVKMFVESNGATPFTAFLLMVKGTKDTFSMKRSPYGTIP